MKILWPRVKCLQSILSLFHKLKPNCLINFITLTNKFKCLDHNTPSKTPSPCHTNSFNLSSQFLQSALPTPSAWHPNFPNCPPNSSNLSSKFLQSVLQTHSACPPNFPNCPPNSSNLSSQFLQSVLSTPSICPPNSISLSS